MITEFGHHDVENTRIDRRRRTIIQINSSHIHRIYSPSLQESTEPNVCEESVWGVTVPRQEMAGRQGVRPKLIRFAEFVRLRLEPIS